VIEPLYGFFAPGGYKDEHITHYTKASLTALAARHQFELIEHAYVLRSELVLALRKSSRIAKCLQPRTPASTAAARGAGAERSSG